MLEAPTIFSRNTRKSKHTSQLTIALYCSLGEEGGKKGEGAGGICIAIAGKEKISQILW